MGKRLGLIALLLVVPTAQAAAQQYVYVWSGSPFSSTSGTISPGSAVTGSIVLQGPIESLPLAEVTPVSFSFSAGPVTIDDATPLHPFTTIRVQTDASGEIIDAVIQLVEEGDATAMGGNLFAADVICVESCDTNETGDVVIDRDASAAVIGTGDGAPAGSFWSSPQVVSPPTVPALRPLGSILAALVAIAAGASLLATRGSRLRRARG